MSGGDATYTTGGLPAQSPSIDRLFRQVFELLPAAVYTCDVNGYITSYNKHAVHLWGRHPEPGKELWCGSFKIFTPEGVLLSPDSCPMAIVLKTGVEVEEREIMIERPDHSRINVISHPKPLFDDHGKMIGAMNMLIDATQQKHHEEKAAILSSIVQSSTAAIISKTLNGIVTSWNPAAQNIFGYSSGEMVGQAVAKLIPHDLYYEEERILERLRQGEAVGYIETKRVRKDGQVIDVSLTVSPVKDDKGKITGVSKIVRDITGVKRAERLMKEGNERFRMAVNATNLGTWEYDPVSQELKWSRECRNIYGFDENDKVDYSVFLRHIHPEDYDFVTRAVEKVMDPAGKGTYDVKFRIRKKNGQIRWVHTHGKVYFSQQGIPDRFIGTVLDITEEKNAKDELERQVSERTRELKMMNKQLQRSNADLAQFAFVASHDLQEPLRKVHMYCDRILNNPGSAEIFDKYLPRIMSASARMSQLIKDVLHYAQISNGSDEVKAVDLNTIFEDVVSDLEVAIKEKHADVKADLLPVIKGDPIQLHQLFANLISNSIKFSRGAPVIRIYSRMLRKNEAARMYRNLTEAASYVELRFEDNGIGFDQKFAEQVFEIFQRLQDRSAYTGTGIGLAVCKKIVENHYGAITVESELEAGTVFTIILPGLNHEQPGR